MRPACLLFGLPACLPSLSAPNAYLDEPWVCDDPAAYRSAVETCDGDPRCGGVASLRGTVEGAPFVVTSPLYQTILRATAEPLVLSRVDAFGAGPYFTFALVAASLGGGLEGTDGERILDYAYEADGLPAHLDDHQLEAEVRFGVPLRSADLAGAPGSGAWTVHEQARERILLSFDGAFGPDADWIEGCATLRPLEVRLE